MNAALLALALLLVSLPAHAGQAEAKELARNFNCTVTGITPVAMETGMSESTSYKVIAPSPPRLAKRTKRTTAPSSSAAMPPCAA
jgi:hypothetical protein